MKNRYSWCVSIVLAVVATVASALPGTFFIEQVYSNADGKVQFVVIYDSGSSDCDAGEDLWANRTLVSEGPGPAKTFVFPTNLPTCMTSKRHMLIATEGFAALGLVTPDYVIPNGFLQIPNGDLYFAGVSPVDIHRASDRRRQRLLPGRNGAARTWPPIFAGAHGVGVGGPAGPSPTLTVVEYHHAAFDHYFITPVAAEIALLDAHAPPFQDWSRTGFSFNAYVNAGAPAGSVAICRFFNDHFGAEELALGRRPRLRLRSHDRPVPGLGPGGRQALQHDAAGRDHWHLSGRDHSGLSDVQPGHGQRAESPLFANSLAERQKMLDQGFGPKALASAWECACHPDGHTVSNRSTSDGLSCRQSDSLASQTRASSSADLDTMRFGQRALSW